MLYVTTRGKNDVYTPARTFQMDCGTDGGFFVPFRMPYFDPKQAMELADKKPSQNIADFLNTLFAVNVTAWDVETALGRDVFHVKSLGQRMVVSEFWHNRGGRFKKSIHDLCRRIYPECDLVGEPAEWLQLGVRIAVMLGLMGELLQNGSVSYDLPINVAVSSGDFSQFMAVWYARDMGLPIKDIIIGCNENGGVWDLITRGCIDTGASLIHTNTPDADYVVPPALERLIHGACGQESTSNYIWCRTEKDRYRPDEEEWDCLRKGIYASVTSQSRLDMLIPNVYRSHGYLMDLYTALAYGALADHRSRSGDGTVTLLLSENSPIYNGETIARIMRISHDELKDLVRGM